MGGSMKDNLDIGRVMFIICLVGFVGFVFYKIMIPAYAGIHHDKHTAVDYTNSLSAKELYSLQTQADLIEGESSVSVRGVIVDSTGSLSVSQLANGLISELGDKTVLLVVVRNDHTYMVRTSKDLAEKIPYPVLNSYLDESKLLFESGDYAAGMNSFYNHIGEYFKPIGGKSTVWNNSVPYIFAAMVCVFLIGMLGLWAMTRLSRQNPRI